MYQFGGRLVQSSDQPLCPSGRFLCTTAPASKTVLRFLREHVIVGLLHAAGLLVESPLLANSDGNIRGCTACNLACHTDDTMTPTNVTLIASGGDGRPLRALFDRPKQQQPTNVQTFFTSQELHTFSGELTWVGTNGRHDVVSRRRGGGSPDVVPCPRQGGAPLERGPLQHLQEGGGARGGGCGGTPEPDELGGDHVPLPLGPLGSGGFAGHAGGGLEPPGGCGHGAHGGGVPLLRLLSQVGCRGEGEDSLPLAGVLGVLPGRGEGRRWVPGDCPLGGGSLEGAGNQRPGLLGGGGGGHAVGGGRQDGSLAHACIVSGCQPRSEEFKMEQDRHSPHHPLIMSHLR